MLDRHHSIQPFKLKIRVITSHKVNILVSSYYTCHFATDLLEISEYLFENIRIALGKLLQLSNIAFCKLFKDRSWKSRL